jgi:hypothetical protein
VCVPVEIVLGVMFPVIDKFVPLIVYSYPVEYVHDSINSVVFCLLVVFALVLPELNDGITGTACAGRDIKAINNK